MDEKSKLVKLREHLDRFLAVYVIISITIGYILGITYPEWVKANSTLINELMMASIFIMIFPMMLMLNLSG
ncbi:MAG: arsenic resistance protein, partial [Thermoplasmata archaeon]